MSLAVRQIILTSLWRYGPDGVQRMMKELRSRAFEKAEYVYEGQWNLFMVACLQGDVERIAKVFAAMEEQLESEVVGSDDIDQILDPSLKALVPSEDSDTPLSRMYLQHESLGEENEFSCPPDFLQYPFIRTWASLDRAKITVHSLLSASRLQDLAQLCGVRMSHDLTGKVVYIGGFAQASVDDAAQRLDTILKYTVCSPAVTHPCGAEYSNVYTIATASAERAASARCGGEAQRVHNRRSSDARHQS
jgi:hypothetical protein